MAKLSSLRLGSRPFLTIKLECLKSLVENEWYALCSLRYLLNVNYSQNTIFLKYLAIMQMRRAVESPELREHITWLHKFYRGAQMSECIAYNDNIFAVANFP